VNWTISLTPDIATCLALRRIVFIEEQNVSEADELDGLDAEALHVLACVANRPVGTARILMSDGVARIGRVCVLQEARGNRLGSAIIKACLDVARAQDGTTVARLGAQTDAVPFYEKLGFAAFGPVYDDAGILHLDMERSL
jgi:ElaA protein